MVAEIHQLKPKPIATNWMCSACGIDAGCNCGAPLMSKAQRAAEAVAANPQKSNRAIAEEIGADEKTVRKARTADWSAVDDDAPIIDGAIEVPRIGLDGKRRRMPKNKRSRGPRFEVPQESQHDRDLKMLIGVWEAACDSARKEFLETVRGN